MRNATLDEYPAFTHKNDFTVKEIYFISFFIAISCIQ